MKQQVNKGIKLILLLAVIVLGAAFAPGQKAYAASEVQICAVSYVDESVLVFTNGNTKIYYATDTDAARGNWDVITAKDEIAVIDFSWLSSNKDNVLKIKGDGDPTQASVMIKKIPQKLEVSIDYSTLEVLADTAPIGTLLNIMASEGDGVHPLTFADLEWRKGENGRWMDTSYLTKGLLESYQLKGTYVYFRMRPVEDVVNDNAALAATVDTYAYTQPKFLKDDGTEYATASTITSIVGTISEYPDGTEGRRAGKEVRLKIAKKTAVPVAGVDGEEFTVAIKYGQEYRAAIGGATPTAWVKVTDRSVKEISLAAIANNPSTYDGLTKPFPSMVIEYRQYATSKAAASKINTITLNAQRPIGTIHQVAVAPSGADPSDKDIYISYNGSKETVVTIPSASAVTPYEYCVVKEDADFDLERATWTPITKDTGVKVSAAKAPEGSELYIRMKEIKYKAASGTKPAVAYELASTYTTMKDASNNDVIFTVSFPSVPAAPKATYVFTKGYTTTNITIPVTLNEAGRLPFESEVASLKLGTKEIPNSAINGFTYTTTLPSPPAALDPATVYTMTITISTSALEAMPNCTGRALYIYYENGTVDKTSTKLTIKNPTAATSLTFTAKPGTTTGRTAFDIATQKPVTSTWVYMISNDKVEDVNKEDRASIIAANASVTLQTAADKSVDNIVVTAGQYLTVFEVDGTEHVLKYKSTQITASKIKS